MRVAGMPVIFSAHSGVLSAEIGREPVEAHGVAVEEGAVVQVLGQQHVAERQHHRGVGVGPDRQPFDRAAVVEILGGRRHVDEAHARVAHAVEAALHVMQRRAAGVDLASSCAARRRR